MTKSSPENLSSTTFKIIKPTIQMTAPKQAMNDNYASYFLLPIQNPTWVATSIKMVAYKLTVADEKKNTITNKILMMVNDVKDKFCNNHQDDDKIRLSLLALINPAF